MSNKKDNKAKEAKKEAKQKMVVMIPKQTFGFERKSYRAGERYVMAQKELPTTQKGKYKTEGVEQAKKAEKAKKKAEAKTVPVVGKKK